MHVLLWYCMPCIIFLFRPPNVQCNNYGFVKVVIMLYIYSSNVPHLKNITTKRVSIHSRHINRFNSLHFNYKCYGIQCTTWLSTCYRCHYGARNSIIWLKTFVENALKYNHILNLMSAHSSFHLTWNNLHLTWYNIPLTWNDWPLMWYNLPLTWINLPL